MIVDTGERREYETGAVRDRQRGKGRCDLLPLQVVAKILGDDTTVLEIGEFLADGNTNHLYDALLCFSTICYFNRETMLLEVAKHFEEGAEKYGENNWQKGLPARDYMDSAIRHYLKYKRGDKDECHDRAFVWNLLCCIWEVDHHVKH